MGTNALQGSDCLIGVAGHDLASGAWQPGVIPLKSYRRLATQEQEELKMGYSAELSRLGGGGNPEGSPVAQPAQAEMHSGPEMCTKLSLFLPCSPPSFVLHLPG